MHDATHAPGPLFFFFPYLMHELPPLDLTLWLFAHSGACIGRPSDLLFYSFFPRWHYLIYVFSRAAAGVREKSTSYLLTCEPFRAASQILEFLDS